VWNGRQSDTEIKGKMRILLMEDERKAAGFIADEIFYDFEKDKLNRNRFSIGFSTKITKRFGW